jgi:hypothetical protein
MMKSTSPKRMPTLPRAGQKVRWRDPQNARASGWEDVFGSGPFEVVRMVDNHDRGLATGIVLRTNLGDWEISEVWLAVADPTPKRHDAWRKAPKHSRHPVLPPSHPAAIIGKTLAGK